MMSILCFLLIIESIHYLTLFISIIFEVIPSIPSGSSLGMMSILCFLLIIIPNWLPSTTLLSWSAISHMRHLTSNACSWSTSLYGLRMILSHSSMVSLMMSLAMLTSFFLTSSLADAKSFFSFWINFSLSQMFVLIPQSSSGHEMIFSFVFSFNGKDTVHSSFAHLKVIMSLAWFLGFGSFGCSSTKQTGLPASTLRKAVITIFLSRNHFITGLSGPAAACSSS